MHLLSQALATFSLSVSKPSSASKSEIPPPNNIVAKFHFGQESSVSRPWSCQCGRQQTHFCPYCEYDRTYKMREFTALKSTTLWNDVNSSGSSRTHISNPESYSKPRKLHKIRKQVQYEALSVEAIVSSRPDSILSEDSKGPLPYVELPANPNYQLPSVVQKMPRNFEKKENRRTDSDPYSPTYNNSSGAESRGRIVKSKSFLSPRNHPACGPRPRPVSGSFDTNALVSLAWTGEVLSSVKSSAVVYTGPDKSSSAYSTFSPFVPKNFSADDEDKPETQTRSNSFLLDNSSPKRPSALRKPREDREKILPQPWTLAMAITDDSITDEMFVDDLENMRIKEKLPDSVVPDPYPLPLGLPPGYYDSLAEYPPESDEVIEEDAGSPLDLSWNSARHALLLCRELVRTERRYLASLKILITNGTSTPPPPSMLSYLPGLIAASETLLSLMEENPSVQGVSQAFIICENTLAESFINWCGVVGQFFNLEENTKNHLSFPPKLRQSHSAVRCGTISADNGLPIVIPEPNRIRRNTRARHAVRDLAILPTQRVTRYVLLLKGLRSLTPAMLPSFVFVENAVQVAESIAAAANEAQGRST
ncbi:hypothetical protein CPB84DRAFT_1760663 [Gymnopilus junonius]|uniref:DH domain-containing protein n=1 Tax=Gymnopilus junonius TaxID=109634 RepID=A0A9P5P2H7_GYMJU|nr:hypothetical protein CPB84DRAFT_1760663 [Gymnopilus junonius]